MSEIYINVIRAVVTAVKEFNSIKGYGVDFYVEAKCIDCTVYLQIVVYDNDARYYYKLIHESDQVIIAGNLKVKPYVKKDGTAGCSLLIERPVEFTKIAGSNSNHQVQQQTKECTETVSSETQSQNEKAVTADDPSDIIKHECTPAEADTTQQEQHAETASDEKSTDSTSQNKKLTTPYWVDSTGKKWYPLPPSEDDEDLPF